MMLMNSITDPEVTLVPSAQRPILSAFGEEVVILLGGEETGGQLALWLETVPPGGGPPPHRHLHEDEVFIVEEGEFEFLANGNWQKIGAGGVVFVPKRAVHTFRNCGDETGRLRISTAPSGFEVFFQRCSEVFAQGDEPDMEAILKIAQEHGIEFVQPPA